MPLFAGGLCKQQVCRVPSSLPELPLERSSFSFFFPLLHPFCCCYFSNCSTGTPGTLQHLAEPIPFTLRFEKTFVPRNTSVPIPFFICHFLWAPFGLSCLSRLIRGTYTEGEPLPFSAVRVICGAKSSIVSAVRNIQLRTLPGRRQGGDSGLMCLL